MRITERYTTAVNSGSLAVDERTTWSDSDVLGAVGYAAREKALGFALLRLLADGKPEPVTSILADMAFRRARTLKVKLSQVQAGDLAKAVLGWYRHGTCQPCGGTGFKVIPGTPALGDSCPHCGGTGRMPFDRQFPEDRRELARWLSGEIDRSQAEAGKAAMAKLAPRLEL